jgi:sec-independent protein translocase protein TatA
MQPFFGLFNLGGGEIILCLALVLILFGAKKLPGLAKGLSDGLLNFRKSVDDEASEAGRSLGGIYGKPAAEALTTDNQVAELYDPAVLQDSSPPHKRSKVLLRLFAKVLSPLRHLFRRIRRTS